MWVCQSFLALEHRLRMSLGSPYPSGMWTRRSECTEPRLGCLSQNGVGMVGSVNQIQIEEMTYEKLSEEVKKLLDNTEEKMIDLIDEYNLSIENKQYEYENEIDTVDLSMKFRELSDYIEDYSQ